MTRTFTHDKIHEILWYSYRIRNQVLISQPGRPGSAAAMNAPHQWQIYHTPSWLRTIIQVIAAGYTWSPGGRPLKWPLEVCVFKNTPGKTLEIFYLPPTMKFWNFEFKFGFGGTKSAISGENYNKKDGKHTTLINYKNRGNFLHLSLATAGRQIQNTWYKFWITTFIESLCLAVYGGSTYIGQPPPIKAF